MIPIKDLLNKIKWDKKENPKDYEIFYYDRILKILRNSLCEFLISQKLLSAISVKLDCLNFSEIKKAEDNLLTVIKDDEEINIPFHRIRKVKKKGKVIWER